MQLSEEFINILYRVPVLLLSFMIHELSHAFVALRFGDTTAQDAGRITLNPIKHIDPLGAILLLTVGFGWAKPVPINPNNFRQKKMGIIFTSLAGPVSNILLAFVFAIPYMYLNFLYSGVQYGNGGTWGQPQEIAANLFYQFLIVNISLAAFNLIPIPPLDGSKVLFAILPDRIYYNYVLRYERYGMILLMALSFGGFLGKLLNPFVNGIYWLISQLIRPIIPLLLR